MRLQNEVKGGGLAYCRTTKRQRMSKRRHQNQQKNIRLRDTLQNARRIQENEEHKGSKISNMRWQKRKRNRHSKWQRRICRKVSENIRKLWLM